MRCFPFLRWKKFGSGCFRQVFSFRGQKEGSPVALNKWSSYIVTIAWEFAWTDSALAVLDEWSSYRGRSLNRFDCN